MDTEIESCRAAKITGEGTSIPCTFKAHHSGLHSFQSSINKMVAALRATAAKSKGGHAYWMIELADELERT